LPRLEAITCRKFTKIRAILTSNGSAEFRILEASIAESANWKLSLAGSFKEKSILSKLLQQLLGLRVRWRDLTCGPA